MGQINILNDAGTAKLSLQFTGTTNKSLNSELLSSITSDVQTQLDSKVSKSGSTMTGDLVLDNGAADGGQLVLKSLGNTDWNIDNYNGSLRFYNGSTVRAQIDSSGRFTMPYQPCFESYKTNSQYYPNTTDGNSGTIVTLSGWTAQFNTGNSFNNTTGVFTAPIAGKYKFCVNLMIAGQRTDNDQQTRWYRNGSYISGSNHVYSATYAQIVVEDIIDLAVGDTVECKIYGSGVKGAYVYSDRYTHISGYLIG